MSYQKGDEKRLTNLIIDEVSEAIQGNQVKSNEINTLGIRTGFVKVNPTVEWLYHVDVYTNTCTGYRTGDVHFSSRHELDDHIQRIQSTGVNSKSIRNKLVNWVKSQKSSALRYTNETKEVHTFDSASVTENCSSCNGGWNTCNACSGSGFVTCFACGGSGFTTQTANVPEQRMNYSTGQLETVYVFKQVKTTCASCGGSGRSRCSACNGSGEIMCSNCSGTGEISTVSQISLNAKPKVSISMHSEFNKDEISDYFTSKSPNFYVNEFPVELDSHMAMSESDTFFYEGKEILIEQILSVKGKPYKIHAFSSKPVIFNKPPIFDDLFKDELKELEMLYIKKNSFNRTKALELFKEYRDQPALDRALVNIASNGKVTLSSAKSTVRDACSGFISEKTSMLIGKAIMGLTKKLTPPYSKFSWFLFWLLFVVPTSLWLSYMVEIGELKTIGMKTEAFTLAIGLICLLSIFPMISSYLYSIVKSRVVPKQYRQKRKYFYPFAYYSIAAVILFLSSIFYGINAEKNIYPKIGTKFISTLGIESWFYTDLHRKLMARRINNASKLSKKQKIMEIQKILSQRGYKIEIDGKIGPVTNSSIDKFFDENNLELPKERNIELIFEILSGIKYSH